MDSIYYIAAAFAALIIGLLHIVFGYKLARILMPLSGALIAVALLDIFALDLLGLQGGAMYVFLIAGGVLIYAALFLIPRASAFFASLTGSAIFIVYIVYAFELFNLAILYPAALTICVLAAIAAAVYKRIGVIVVSALLGGCIFAPVACLLYLEGFPGLAALQNVLGSIAKNAYTICIVAFVCALLGTIIQYIKTANGQLIENKWRAGKRRSKNINIIV